ncbi:MAG: DUF748 domain-containing protein, partial [Gammaproteobacteria bacterium]|nr:DUF748 domain-containing protein [Gammaproteobacteria bacterium]
NKTIEVTKVSLDSLNVNIKQYTDAIIISGINIPLGQTPQNTENKPEETKTIIIDKDVKSWTASLGELVFTNLNVCYLQHTSPLSQSNKDSRILDYCVDLKEMFWAGTISYATDSKLLESGDIPLSSTGDFSLNGLSVTDNRLGRKLLTSQSNTLHNVIISGLNNIHLDQLEMNALSLLQRENKKHSDSIRFSQLIVNDITLSDLKTLVINNINISEPGVYLVKQNETDWEYQQWIPQSSTTDKPASKNHTQKNNGPSFNLTLNDLNIANSDLCYLDNNTSLYYCLTFEELGWKGLVKYDTKPTKADAVDLLVKGDLTLIQPNIHNQRIDRDLINFVSLDLTGLDVTGTDKISLSKLALKKLNALQRSKNNNDNTASFDNLAINDIQYKKNNIAINSVNLKGLASTVSKNKKGVWEHNKWIIENKVSEQASPDKKKDVTDKNQTPFVIALNKLNITSDKKILFTDNSTEPATDVGLQKLAFDISSLYTTKPDSNSPFKLHAKTIRHSTIDIEGTIKPFADKISMAAFGKLKGFDLRAASPSTKKAIGHIIQSGQLDADLNLKADNGVLDSNIALSLYHFQMKSVSKKDAAKLDEKFGMPLNQTLVLLRDKDDSIHLDIPITGDVNNPNFDPMDAIFKATSKAATVTLITFYTPYGLIYAGGNIALNLATALNFDPIEFDPGSTELQTNSKEQLDGLSKLLIEKPQVHLTLCGITNKQDVFALYPELKPKKENADKTNKDAPLTKEQTLKLDQLARDRQVNSKNYLIKQHNIDHSRLILCAPEHKDNDENISGVEINI